MHNSATQPEKSIKLFSGAISCSFLQRKRELKVKIETAA